MASFETSSETVLFKVLELLLALVAGGTVSVFVKGYWDKSKSTAETKKISAEGESKIVDVALRMANKLEDSLKALEIKTEDLAKKNLKLEYELSELRLSNINMVKEIEALKIQNNDLEKTCKVLIKENTHLKIELENCIKKEL
jgi:predicted RNase H-like nuclease (RuvC/YqgF family)